MGVSGSDTATDQREFVGAGTGALVALRSQASKTEDRTILSVDDLLVIYATARFPELRISRKGWRHWVRKCEARPVFCGSAAE